MMGSLFWGYLDPLFYSSDGSPRGIDFFAIYEAGHSALENRSVYDYDLDSSSGTPFHSPYRYVPFFAYAFAVPANALPPWWAYWGWVAFNELLLIANVFATLLFAGRGRWGVIAAAMWLVFPLFYVEQHMGQFSFLMATALFWLGIGMLRGREALGGIPWAASVVAKSNSALLAPLLLRIGWWRSLIGGAVLVGLNVPYFLWRPGDLEVFFRKNFTDFLNEDYLPYSPGDHGALALLQNTVKALDSPATQVPAAITVGLMIGVVGCSLVATFLARKTDSPALFAIWVSAFFLSYGVVWEFHYVMLLPALVLLVAFRPPTRPWALAVFALVALPTPYWLLTHVWNTGPIPDSTVALQHVWPAWGVVLYHAANPVPVALLWTGLVVSQLRGGFSLDWFRKLRPSASE
jgi:hypothetical protein